MGVERPEDVRLCELARSGILRAEPSTGVSARGESLCFNEECRGGDGARVDVECDPFENSRDILVVVVEVLMTGVTGGDRGENVGGERGSDDALLLLLPAADGGRGGCLSKISRSDSSVRYG